MPRQDEAAALARTPALGVADIERREVKSMSWVFGCNLGLGQDSCGRYEADKTARGYDRYGGCPSCLHRDPADNETADAEDYHERDRALRGVGL
jgi:hypothetical protein